jgi:hypothetical protein
MYIYTTITWIRFSLPEYRIGVEISSASETDTTSKQLTNMSSLMSARPLPAPPTPPKLRPFAATAYSPLPLPRSIAFPHLRNKIVRIEDVPPEVVQTIIEISKNVILNSASEAFNSVREKTIKELGEGLSVPELKVSVDRINC